MDGLDTINGKFAERKAKNRRHLHSPDHVLADELSTKLRDTRHFGYYLKMATTHNHQVLRNILGQVLEGKDVKNPGKLFTFLLKKHDSDQSSK